MGKSAAITKKKATTKKASVAKTTKKASVAATITKKASVATTTKETTWVCVTTHAGSGMVPGYKLCVSQQEYRTIYSELKPHVRDYWGTFHSEGEWPVLTIDEAKTMFFEVLGDILPCVSFEQFEECIQQKRKEMEDRLRGYKEQLYLKC